MVKKGDAGERIRSVPGVGPALMNVAGHKVQRLLGYWVIWHAFGGDIDAMIRSGVLSRGGAYAQRNEFRQVFGVEVGEFWPEMAAAIPRDGADRG